MNFPNGKLTITITYVNFSPQQLIYKRKRKPQAEWSITWLYTFTPKPDKAPKSTFQRGVGLRTDSLLWEVEMESKCLLLMLLRECWSVFWVACNICGRMLVCGMSIRMTASHPGQEEELLFFCWTLFRQTHSRHEGGTLLILSSLQLWQNITRQEELSDIWVIPFAECSNQHQTMVLNCLTKLFV